MESPCFWALAHKNRGIREVLAFLRLSCWGVVSLEWVCLSPTDVILREAFGGVIHERSKASPLSCHPERSEAESNPKGAPRSGAGSPPSVGVETGKMDSFVC